MRISKVNKNKTMENKTVKYSKYKKYLLEDGQEISLDEFNETFEKAQIETAQLITITYDNGVTDTLIDHNGRYYQIPLKLCE